MTRFYVVSDKVICIKSSCNFIKFFIYNVALELSIELILAQISYGKTYLATKVAGKIAVVGNGIWSRSIEL